jgi:hypothetical protein
MYKGKSDQLREPQYSGTRSNARILKVLTRVGSAKTSHQCTTLPEQPVWLLTLLVVLISGLGTRLQRLLAQ